MYCLVYKISYNGENGHHNFKNPKVKPSNCIFVHQIVQNPKTFSSL